jgi:hypothetical protein
VASGKQDGDARTARLESSYVGDACAIPIATCRSIRLSDGRVASFVRHVYGKLAIISLCRTIHLREHCNELLFQKETLEAYQEEKDQVEQSLLLPTALGADDAASNPTPGWEGLPTSEEPEYEDERYQEDTEESVQKYDDDIRVSAGYLD